MSSDLSWFAAFAMDYTSGGPMMTPIAFLGLAAWAAMLASSVHVLTGRAPKVSMALRSIAGTCGALCIGLGAFGCVRSFQIALQAIARVNPSDALTLVSAAGAESLTVMKYGFGLGMVPVAATWLLAGITTHHTFAEAAISTGGRR